MSQIKTEEQLFWNNIDEIISNYLKEKYKHKILNAKNHQMEEIIEAVFPSITILQIWQKTDIKLGNNNQELKQKAIDFLVIGTSTKVDIALRRRQG